MRLARVIGTVWATRKHPGMEGLKMLLIQPVSSDERNSGGTVGGGALAAFDSVGAGEGELVYYVEQYEATLPFPDRQLVPLDVAIVGIVDRVDDESERVFSSPDRGEAGA